VDKGCVDTALFKVLEPRIWEIAANPAQNAHIVCPDPSANRRISGISSELAGDDALVRGDTIILPQSSNEDKFRLAVHRSDYTVRFGSDHMIDLLEMQKDLAPEHIRSSWPFLRDQANSLPTYSAIEHIVICGCGDSHHASVGLGMGLSTPTGITCSPSHAMNASRYLVPGFSKSPEALLVIGISASGEVARTIEAIEVANHIGARTLAFTGDPSSTLADTAEVSIVFPGPELPHGPGLISYLTSLMMGYALIHRLLDSAGRSMLETALSNLESSMNAWIQSRWDAGVQFADRPGEGTCVFLGSGPAYGTALFSAAKLIEAAGEYAWGQDVEEWAHLEYFCAPAGMRTWLLSGSGRSISREVEVREAAEKIGRSWIEDRCELLVPMSEELNEILSPLVLWAGPCGYAARRTSIQGEVPFREFGGGRDRSEGGGASRIRSSERFHVFGG
jgi:glucosamine--fructose-6-phosphate aminotransferase (isomerizing)